MSDISSNQIERLGFRFLGDRGRVDARLDEMDVLADPEGEIVYTPHDRECLAKASDALAELVSGRTSRFECKGAQYNFELKQCRIVHKAVYGEIQDPTRQKRGFRHAMQRISLMEHASMRVAALAALASSMKLAGSAEYSQMAGMRMCMEISRMDDACLRYGAIAGACETISGDRHPMGLSSPLFAMMLPMAREIDEPDFKSLSLSIIARSICAGASRHTSIVVPGMEDDGPLTCDELFAEAGEEALMVMDRQRQYGVRAQVAAEMASVGMGDEASAAFNEMIEEIETVAYFGGKEPEASRDPELSGFFGGLVDILHQIGAAGLGEHEFPLVRRCIMHIDGIADEALRAEAIGVASALIAGSEHPDAFRMQNKLMEFAIGLEDSFVRGMTMVALEGAG